MKALRTHMHWFPAVMAVLFIGIIGLHATVSRAQAESGKGPELLPPGQSAAYGDLEVALLSLKKTREYINGPKPGHTYAVLRFRVKNQGKQEESARMGSSLQWKDPASGNRSSYARTTGVKLNNPEEHYLAPGAQGEFEEVYMLPDTLAEVEFHLLKSYNPKEAARWMLPLQ